MNTQEQASQTENDRDNHRNYCGLSRKTLLHFLSSLLLPLTLGVFTVFITFEQQEIARQQWLEDKNESRLQRDQELKIAYEERAALSQVNQDRYRDELLVAYIKEIGDMLKDNNGSLTSDPLTHILARAKTLNAIGQLDGLRQARIIRFLYEAKQLTNTNHNGALDISTAELINTDFDKLRAILQNKRLSLAGVHLINCTFEKFYISTVNFSSAWLSNVNFSSAVLDNVNFSSTIFGKYFGTSSFDYAKMVDTIFTDCRCTEISFVQANLKSSSFRNAFLQEAEFAGANLQNVDFTNAQITDEQLYSALSIRGAILPNGSLGIGQNLIENGNANCSISLSNHWRVLYGNVMIVASPANQNECQFVLKSDTTTSAVMVQRINLANVWNSSIWTNSSVDLQARITSGVSIELHGLAHNGTTIDSTSGSLAQNRIRMELTDSIKEIEVVVKFKSSVNTNNEEMIWCDDIELFVDYNAY